MGPTGLFGPGRNVGAVFFPALLSMALLAGCAREPIWHKTGATKAIFEQDTTTCFRAASIQAEQQVDRRGVTTSPQIELRSSVGRIRDATGATREAVSLQEKALRSKLYSQCMQRLGYRLNKPE